MSVPAYAIPDQPAPDALPAAIGQMQVQKGQEGCLLCHKYPGLGRYDKDARNRIVKRVFYVNEDIHKASYHGRFNCSDCHEGVDKIPHTDAKKVDCGKTCHLNEPSSGKKFSHKAMVEDLEKSAHGSKGASAETGECSFFYFNSITPPIEDIDGDQCGDLQNAAVVTAFPLQAITFTCTDPDGDGFVSIPSCVS